MKSLFSRKVETGFVLLAGCNIPEHILYAKEYIKKNELTNEDVRLIGNNNEILIITKRDIDF